MTTTIINERYELLQTLGAGGMAIVHKARDMQMDRFVAVKILRDQVEGGESTRKRFFNEAKMLANLSHSNIVFIYDFGIDNNQPFIVMEYLHGNDLHEMIQKRYPLSLEQKLKIAIQIARALKYAHANGIVHRDIKPSNVRILKDGVAKLMDFGIAKVGEHSVASQQGPELVLGSLRYMSPEQLEGKQVTPPSDIFSFGSTLYELLTYRPAFAGDSIGAVLAAVSFDEPAPLGPGFPERLHKLLAACMRKSPQERVQTADRLLQELKRVEEDLWSRALAQDQTKAGRLLLSDTGEEGDPTLLANAPELSEDTELLAQPLGEATKILDKNLNKGQDRKPPKSEAAAPGPMLFGATEAAPKNMMPWVVAGVLGLLALLALAFFLLH